MNYLNGPALSHRAIHCTWKSNLENNRELCCFIMFYR